MENQKYRINNSNYLILDGTASEIRILSGRAFLFISRKLQNGLLGARNSLDSFNAGNICPNIPGNDEYEIYLVGTDGTEVEAAPVLDENYCSQMIQKRNEIIKKLEAEEKAEETRNVEQQKLSDKNYSNSITNIASVVNPKLEEKIIYGSEDQPIVKAFKVLAEKMGGLTINASPEKKYETSKTGYQALAKDNTIRIREIILRDTWYKEDNGHLLGFYNPSEKFDIKKPIEETEGIIPVALIRDNEADTYIIVDCESQKNIHVTRENAKKIHPMAFMAYKHFGKDKITIKDICKFVLEDIKKDLASYIVIGFMCTLIGLITPYITRHLIDQVIPHAQKNRAIQLCVLTFFCNISAMVGQIAKYFAGLRMETRADSNLEAAVFDRLLKLPVNFFKDYSSGDLASRTMAITTVRKQIFGIVLSCFMNFIFSFVYLFQEFQFCGYFAKWGVLFCIVPILISIISSLITYSMQKMLVDAQGKIQGMLLQFFSGIQKITNSNSENRVFAQWSKEYIRQTKIGYRLGNIGIYLNLITSLYPTIVTIILYFLFGQALESKKVEGLSTGSFLAFMSAYGSFQSAFLGVAGSLISIRDIIPLLKRVKPVLEAKTEYEESKPAINSISGSIEISHLNFRYDKDSPLILKDINIKIEPGEFVAIVGTSGAGKSTLLRLILGFEKAESGSIFFDNQDINSIDIGSLRRQMGIVLQNDSVLQGTILQNIVGSTGLKIDDAWEAARKVSFDKDIQEMPMGMFTIIPPKGLSLSGGQLQRLIIARAIIRNPKLLIFDEATSALDNITQQTVRESLDGLASTRIIIAHRLSTIINADRIYVMKDGEIVETGTYDELVERDGYFTQLAKRQNV
ncbi:MAG: NHLP bacteriocin export ABC transporter permease/ATPase subunit [Treponema sp.]|nr:NHLP bacteriocin export ABC transporter permease/ATPase subunit [Treponema sp.]